MQNSGLLVLSPALFPPNVRVPLNLRFHATPSPGAWPALFGFLSSFALAVGKDSFSINSLILTLGIRLKFRSYFPDTQVISSLFLRHILGAWGDVNFLGHEIWHGSNLSGWMADCSLKT